MSSAKTLILLVLSIVFIAYFEKLTVCAMTPESPISVSETARQLSSNEDDDRSMTSRKLAGYTGYTTTTSSLGRMLRQDDDNDDNDDGDEQITMKAGEYCGQGYFPKGWCNWRTGRYYSPYACRDKCISKGYRSAGYNSWTDKCCCTNVTAYKRVSQKYWYCS